jgi:hypothetical protein
VAPRPPPSKFKQLVDADVDDDAEAEAVFRLPANAPAWQRKLVRFMKFQCKIPEAPLALMLRISWRVYVGLLAWAALVKIASLFDFGPIVIVGTVFVGIAIAGFTQRKEGSLSAYSLFNPNLQRLPGQLTAEHLDGQVRGGQM